MRKYVLILVGLIFAAVMTGCGESDTSETTVSGITTSPILAPEVTALTFKNQSTAGFSRAQLNPDTTATWGTAATKTGTWQISNGTIVVTDSSNGTSQTFTRIQTEAAYWLVFDASTKIIFRLYFDANAFATDTENAREFANYNPRFMGGAVQSGAVTTLPTALKVNVSQFAGRLPGVFGFTNASSAIVPGFSNTTTARRATFKNPLDITTPDGKTYYVLDYYNIAIRVINAAGNVSTLNDENGAQISLSAAQGITSDDKNIYVAETGTHVIRQINRATKESKIIAGTSGSSGAIDAIGTAAKFNSPTGITTDGTNLYVADSGNHTIRKIQISTQSVTTLAGFAGTLGTSDGIFTDARFNAPVRLTTDGSRLYVTDFNNRTVRSVQIATGQVFTIAGKSGVKAEQIDSNVGSNARFNLPQGITTDGTNLYVTDYNTIVLPKPGKPLENVNMFSNKIRKIVISSGEVSTVAGGLSYPEVAATNSIPDVGTSALFATPRGIVWDGTKLLVTNGTFNFETDGINIFNQTSVFNVILQVSLL